MSSSAPSPRAAFKHSLRHLHANVCKRLVLPGVGALGGEGLKGGVLKPLSPGAQSMFKYVHRSSLLVASASDTSAEDTYQ